MAETPKALTHNDPEARDDESCIRDAQSHLVAWPQLQVLSEVISKARSIELPWWSPTFTRETWSATTRMGWLAQRADLRQQITSQLTGLPKKSARTKTPEFQAALIDAVIDDGDVPVATFEQAFDPRDLVIYGPAEEIWHRFVERIPFEEDSHAHQRFSAWFLRAILTERGGPPFARRFILTPWDVRNAIDARTWQSRVPLEVRVAVDEARLRQEKARSRDCFHARNELAIATPEVLAASLPFAALAPVFAIAGRAMGFSAAESDSIAPEDSSRTSSTHLIAAPSLGLSGAPSSMPSASGPVSSQTMPSLRNPRNNDHAPVSELLARAI